jgi:hypothetical protein
MLMLTLGVMLWSFAHLFKRLAPTVREGMGDGGKLVVTLALIGSIALMTSGYQSAVGSIWWVRQPSWVLLNNALMAARAVPDGGFFTQSACNTPCAPPSAHCY